MDPVVVAVRRPRRRASGSYPRDERGAVLIVALAVVLVMAMLSLVAVSGTLHGLTQAADVRKQVQSVAAAEAGLEAELANVQKAVHAYTSSPLSIACPSASQYIDVAPGSSYGQGTGAGNISSVESYSLQYGTGISVSAAESSLAACTGSISVSGLSGTWYLEIASTGISASSALGAPDVRKALLKVNSQAGSPRASAAQLDKADFANAGFAATGSVAISPSGTNIVDVYTNGPLACPADGSSSIDGSLQANPSVSSLSGGQPAVEGACSVNMNVVATRGDIQIGSSSAGPEVVDGSVAAENGTVSVPNGVVYGSIYSYPQPTPSSLQFTPEQFPVIDDAATDLAAWTSAGFSQYTTHVDICATGLAGYEASPQFASGPSLWVAPSSCAVALTGSLTIGEDTVIFAPGGFLVDNFAVQDAPGTNARLFLIVPYSAGGDNSFEAADTCPASTPPGFVLDDSVGSSTAFDANTLLYSPCDITGNGSNTVDGQVYAGRTWGLSGSFAQSYSPVNPPTGGANTYSGSGSPTVTIQSLTFS